MFILKGINDEKMLLSLILLSTANAYAVSHNQTALCSHQVYVNAQNAVLLKTKPNAQSHTVMELKLNQYLCVVANAETAEGWTLVKKVAPINTQKVDCDASDSSKCAKIADFPTIWQVKKPQGKDVSS